jgi:hypothetical protein
MRSPNYAQLPATLRFPDLSAYPGGNHCVNTAYSLLVRPVRALSLLPLFKPKPKLATPTLQGQSSLYLGTINIHSPL